MNKQKRKGFTIVELVIVIAVIAILSAVLIPTFSSVVENAKESAATQEARNTYVEYVASVEDGNIDSEVVVKVGAVYYNVKDGKVGAVVTNFVECDDCELLDGKVWAAASCTHNETPVTPEEGTN